MTLAAVTAPGLATGGASHPAPQPRLVAAAHEFEAQMMKELLKPLTAGDGAGDDGENSGGPMREFAAESLGRAVSNAGGLGIANRIVASLSATGHHPESKQ